MLPHGDGLHREISSKAMPLFFKVKADHPDAHFFAYYLEYLTFHMPEKMLIPALEWLIKNRIVGPRFYDYVKSDCAASGLELIRNLTMRLEREKRLRTLTAKDLQ